MSAKWTSSSETGILRKNERKEKKEELFVFGYSCKLFRDNEKALHIDQGKHLIPWMGDETLKIDRYDARGALHELASLEAPTGGYDWRVELTRAELDVEQLCDEERYRALHTNEDEEEMYKEEELKRLHAAGYGQVGFNYDNSQESTPKISTTDVDEAFILSPQLQSLLPADIVLPDGQKLNAIIEKTAKFIASQGAQMEILLKAKQADNVQFQFLNKDSSLRPYYEALIALVKAGKWPEKKEEVVEVPEKHQENEEYLHPSLGATVIESAPSIPSIHYKPSADCDYTMLISKIKGVPPPEEKYDTPLAPGELPPPGTETLRLPPPTEISKPPVMYTHGAPTDDTNSQAYMTAYNQYAAYYQQYASPAPAQRPQPANGSPQPVSGTNPNTTTITPSKSTGLSLMKHYNTDSDTDNSDSEDSIADNDSSILTPPDDVQLIISKMATYVARNGDEFAEIVRAKNDPRFTFLDPTHQYYPFYKRLMDRTRAGVNGVDQTKDEAKRAKAELKASKKAITPVSFSIKKQKEPEPVLPKPALPYESSSDEESENKQTDEKSKETPHALQEVPATPKVPHIPASLIPPSVVYRIEPQEVVIEKTKVEKPPVVIEKVITKPQDVRIEPIKDDKTDVRTDVAVVKEVEEKTVSEKKRPAPPPKVFKEEVDYRRDRKKANRKREHRSKSESRDRKRSRRPTVRSPEESCKRKHREIEIRKPSRDEPEKEVISLEENVDELIDLTGELSDSRVEGETEVDKSKQVARRRRAAEFLRRVGVDNNSLASAMVETLHSLQKKKQEAEERKRRREKRRHRDRCDSDGDDRSHRKSKRRKNRSPGDKKHDDNDSDYERKKKRKKDKKHWSSSKSRKRRSNETEELSPQNLKIDLSNTLKELRSSPTRALGLEAVEDNVSVHNKDRSSGSEVDGETEPRHKKKKKKKDREDREYSEGEWASSDSDEDSYSTRSHTSE